MFGHQELLEATPQKEFIRWGLHFERGYDKHIIFFLCTVQVLFSVVFGIVWSVKRGDIQGGFAGTGCVLTFAVCL
jgi:hypothetical protein